MIRKTLFFALSILMLASCTKNQYAEGLTVTKFGDGTIFTADGREIPLKPSGFEDATTIVLVRHAEALSDEDNPGLSEAGFARADRLAELVFPMDIQEVFMTSLRRTIFTARPLASKYSLPVSTYTPEQYDNVLFKIFTVRSGKNVMIYGHSNTTPDLVNKITGNTNLDNIPHDQYDNIFVVTSKGEGAESVVYKFKF